MTDLGSDGSRGRRDGRAWWSSRLLELIEGMSLPDPLRTGRALVRTEAVLSVRRSGNLVVAMVRDQGDDLHKARLAVRTFGDRDWGRIEAALASEARYAAALLAGSMPAGIEKAFAALGLSLFPTRADDLAMDCTCADWQRPCAHLVAAGHHLADAVDADPFALLALRGRERDALLGEIRHRRPLPSTPPGPARRTAAWPSVPAAVTGARGASPTPDEPAEAGEPLPSAPAAFWSSPVPAGGGTAPPDRAAPPARAAPPGRGGILLDLCGPLTVEPFGDLRDALRGVYEVLGSSAGGDGQVG